MVPSINGDKIMTDKIKCPTDMKFTIEKKDARTKKGYRVIDVLEVGDPCIEMMASHLRDSYPTPAYRIKVDPLYVVRTNLMSGKEFVERFDTPSYCSPSCESYFTM